MAAQHAVSRIGAERDELAAFAPTPAPPVEPASQNGFAALRGLSRSHHRQVALGRSDEQRRVAGYTALHPPGGGLGAETDAHRVGQLTGDGEGGGGNDPDPGSPRCRGEIVGAPRLRERQPEMGGGRIGVDLGAGEDFARPAITGSRLGSLLGGEPLRRAVGDPASNDSRHQRRPSPKTPR